MNKILTDYISCIRKRLITDLVQNRDAAEELACHTWDRIRNTNSRTVIRDNPALREALAMNSLLDVIKKDSDLRAHIEKEAQSEH